MQRFYGRQTQAARRSEQRRRLLRLQQPHIRPCAGRREEHRLADTGETPRMSAEPKMRKNRAQSRALAKAEAQDNGCCVLSSGDDA